MRNILITGGTGLIGMHLGLRLQEKGYKVTLLSRSARSGALFPVIRWDPDLGKDITLALDQADGIIHLAGAHIGAKRWTPKRKQQILDSRVKTGSLLFDAIEQGRRKPTTFISASATGYYGALTADRVFDERAPAHDDFLGHICLRWEESADRFKSLGIRTIKLRTGIVLSRQGGALPRLSLPVRLGVGAPLGSGKQYMPWIHMEDLCGIFIHALENPSMEGAYNAVAPEHATNLEFTTRLAGELKRPLWLPHIPAWFMKLLFGEMSVMLLEGSRVSSEKIREAGYQFQFPELSAALNHLFAPPVSYKPPNTHP
jgi:uncharacterized protein (TIGR01777 family)